MQCSCCGITRRAGKLPDVDRRENRVGDDIIASVATSPHVMVSAVPPDQMLPKQPFFSYHIGRITSYTFIMHAQKLMHGLNLSSSLFVFVLSSLCNRFYI